MAPKCSLTRSDRDKAINVGNASGLDQFASAKSAEFLSAVFFKKPWTVFKDSAPPKPAKTGNSLAEVGIGFRDISTDSWFIFASLSLRAFSAMTKASCI